MTEIEQSLEEQEPRQIPIDLDDVAKVNYNKFSKALRAI